MESGELKTNCTVSEGSIATKHCYMTFCYKSLITKKKQLANIETCNFDVDMLDKR